MLTTVAFGVIKSTERAGKVHVSLLDYHKLPLSFVLNTKDKITVPTCPLTLSALDETMLRSLDIRLETLTALRRVNPDILIGIDYFWDIVTTETPVTLPSGLVLCHTRFGPTISGSKFFRSVFIAIRHRS
ncbi:unnamed protein product [Haemonchus placei]|uniref:DUF1758 domain-containing protein n=1 Tax=Haemonchus placei TaxID=6290 RepID=A0A0N4X0S8_HAEPC|nr:unnamed protein product [Haemonchus placei]